MCLHNSKELVLKFLKETKRKKRKWVWKYKVLGKNYFRKFLYSPYFSQNYWIAGIHKSNSSSTKPTLQNIDIRRGIHVCNTKERAQKLMNNGVGPIIVRVRCCVKDLIGVSNNESVFTKVYLPKSEYLKATKN